MASDRNTLSYMESGSGDPVLLLDWTPWQSPVLADALSGRYRVVSLEPPSDAGLFPTADNAASAVAQVADSAGLDSYVLVGASLGADVALRVALLDSEGRGPGSVATLVLISPLCVAPAAYLPWSTPDLALTVLLAHPEDSATVPPDAGRTETLSALAERWRPDLKGETGGDTAGLLPGVACATLAVFGQEDRLVSRAAGGVWKERVPNGNVCYVYDAGHAIAVDRPDALVSVVLDFVERRETFIVENRSFLVNP